MHAPQVIMVVWLALAGYSGLTSHVNINDRQYLEKVARAVPKYRAFTVAKVMVMAAILWWGGFWGG